MPDLPPPAAQHPDGHADPSPDNPSANHTGAYHFGADHLAAQHVADLGHRTPPVRRARRPIHAIRLQLRAGLWVLRRGGRALRYPELQAQVLQLYLQRLRAGADGAAQHPRADGAAQHLRADGWADGGADPSPINPSPNNPGSNNPSPNNPSPNHTGANNPGANHTGA
jgi:hypothetical protein